MVTEFLYEVTELNKEYPVTHVSTITRFKFSDNSNKTMICPGDSKIGYTSHS